MGRVCESHHILEKSIGGTRRLGPPYVLAQRAAGNDEVDVRVVTQGASPGVQHAREAEPRRAERLETGGGRRYDSDMRDHTTLRAFELADRLAILVYEHTSRFPREEQFGLTSQMRRAGVSIVCNIVEGCARESLADYIRFLDMAYGSARELEYQITLAQRLGYLRQDSDRVLADAAVETCKVLNGLIRSLRSS